MKIFITCSIFLFFYIGLDILFNDELWKLNTQLTLYLQENQFYGEKEMFAVFSYSLYVLPSIALIAFFFMDNKLGALLYGLMILVTIAINSLLKNIYHQERPYFVVQEIQPYECNKEFGKPSGHAMCSFAMCFLLPSILFPAVWKDQENCKYPKIVRITVIFIISLWAFMTGFSRIFMGAHTLGQILLGWNYEFYIVMMYMNYCHEPIMNYIKLCLQPGSMKISNSLLIKVGTICTLWTVLSIIFFELNKRVFLSEAEVNKWMNALLEKCPNQMTLYNINSPSVLQNICFSLSLYVWIVFSFLLGIKLTNGVYFENQFSQCYFQLPIYKKILRVILLLALIATLIPLILVKFDNTYVQAFIQIFLVSIFGGLILTLFYSKLLSFFKLSINGDFIQLSPQFDQAPEGSSFEMQPKSV